MSELRKFFEYLPEYVSNVKPGPKEQFVIDTLARLIGSHIAMEGLKNIEVNETEEDEAIVMPFTEQEKAILGKGLLMLESHHNNLLDHMKSECAHWAYKEQKENAGVEISIARGLAKRLK